MGFSILSGKEFESEQAHDSSLFKALREVCPATKIVQYY